MDLADYFAKAHSAFKHSGSGSFDTADYFLRLAEKFTVRLSFANTSIVPIFLPVFEHLLTDPVESADLTICAWEGDKKPPYPTWQGLTNFKSVDLLTSERVNILCELSPARLTAIDLERKTALFWIGDAAQLPGYVRCCPFRTIIHWWAASIQRYLVHAAAIGTSKGGVLIVGPGGSGKSSTALSCIRQGFSYVSDDYCLVESDGLQARAHSIYSCAKVDMSTSVSRLAHLERFMIDRSDLHTEKEVMLVNQHFPERVAPSCAVRAILIPRITGECNTTIVPAKQDQAARALIPSTMSQLPGSSVDDFYGMIKLTRLLPSYYLDLGTEVEQIPAAIENLLSFDLPSSPLTSEQPQNLMSNLTSA